MITFLYKSHSGIFTVIVGIFLGGWINGNALAQPSNKDTLKLPFKRYLIKKYQDKSTGMYKAEVFWENKKVYNLEAGKESHLQFVAVQDKHTYDITQDSIHNFIFQEYLGGKTRETCWYILSLGKKEFKVLDTICTQYSVPWLGDFKGDGKYEIIVKDYIFANWNASFLDSPYQIVMLQYEEGKYRIMPEAMKKKVDYSEELVNTIKESLYNFYETNANTYPYKVNVLGGKPEMRWSFISPKLWTKMMELFYTGNGEKIKTLVDAVWHPKLEGKDTFLADFQKVLKTSFYWNELKAINQ